MDKQSEASFTGLGCLLENRATLVWHILVMVQNDRFLIG